MGDTAELQDRDTLQGEETWIVNTNFTSRPSANMSLQSVPIGGQIPITIRLNPLSKMKLFRLTAILEEVRHC